MKTQIKKTNQLKKIAKYIFIYSSFISSFWGILLISCFFIMQKTIFYPLILSLFFSTALLFFAVKENTENKKRKEVNKFFDASIIRLFSVAWIFYALKPNLAFLTMIIIILHVISKSYFKKINFKHILINSAIGTSIGFLSFYLFYLI